jgi:hypothetical protein
MSSPNQTNPLRHLHRTRADWSLFLRAYPLVWFIRIALWALPFPKLHAWAAKVREGKIGDRPLDPKSVYKVVWAVSAAARRVPKATCLTQALATQIMLGRRGHKTTLHFGARKDGERLDAHAWIEREGRILIGFNDNFRELARFPNIERERPEFHENGG